MIGILEMAARLEDWDNLVLAKIPNAKANYEAFLARMKKNAANIMDHGKKCREWVANKPAMMPAMMRQAEAEAQKERQQL